MVGETDANAGTPRESAPRAHAWLGKAWRVFRILLAIGLGVFAIVRSLDPELRERKAMQRGDVEQLQSLQSGPDAYALQYFRSAQANIVTKNGQRVFDSRDAATRGCIRLVRREGGRVELECQHPTSRQALFFPMP